MVARDLQTMATSIMITLVVYALGFIHGMRAEERLQQTERGVSCQVQDWPMPGEARIGFIRCEGPGEFSTPQLPSE